MKIFQTLLLFVAIAAFGCGSSDNRPVGEWKITSFEANAPNIPEYHIEDAKKEALLTSYILNADSTLGIKSSALGDSIIGKWTYNDSTKIIEATMNLNNNSTKEQFEVKYRDDTSMIWFLVIPEVGDLTIGLTKQPE